MRLLALVFGLAGFLVQPAFAQGIEVHDPYIVVTGPDAPTAAAYLVVHNHWQADDTLLAVESAAAARVEIHVTTENADGVMQMRPVPDGLPLDSGDEIVLERGGDHIMLMGLTASLEDGALVPVTLVFEKAGRIEVMFPVNPPGLVGADGAGMDHDH